MMDFLQDKYQRFTLYMLDNFGILVSVWPIVTNVLLIFVVIATYIFAKSNDIITVTFTVAFLASTTRFVCYPQYLKELNYKYKEYSILQLSFANNKILKIFNILAFIIILFVNCNRFYWLGGKSVFVCCLCFDVLYISFFLFMACYTRERSPPTSSNMSFSPS